MFIGLDLVNIYDNDIYGKKSFDLQIIFDSKIWQDRYSVNIFTDHLKAYYLLYIEFHMANDIYVLWSIWENGSFLNW